MRGGIAMLDYGRGVLVMRGASVVRGVRVSGAVSVGQEGADDFEGGTLLVHGRRASRGRLEVRNARATGRLGGRRVSVRLVSLTDPGAGRIAALRRIPAETARTTPLQARPSLVLTPRLR